MTGEMYCTCGSRWPCGCPQAEIASRAREVEESKNRAGEAFINAIMIQARPKGITPELEGPFLLWIGNECWEGREPDGFLPVIARTPMLVKRFLAERSPKVVDEELNPE